MQREHLYQIEVSDVEVRDIGGDITLFFICPNEDKKIFLQHLLFNFKREIVIKPDNDGIDRLYLFFVDFNYRHLLVPEKRIEEIKGYQWILNKDVLWVNTSFIDDNNQERTDLGEKISLYPL